MSLIRNEVAWAASLNQTEENSAPEEIIPKDCKQTLQTNMCMSVEETMYFNANLMGANLYLDQQFFESARLVDLDDPS